MVESDKTVRHRSDVPTIRELIQRAVDDGKTFRALEAASGDRVKFQTFQNLVHNAPLQFPKDNKTIEGMAAALGVPEATVVLGYAKGLGLDITTDSLFADLLPRGTDELDVEFQNALVSVVRAAIRMQKGVHHAVENETPSGTPPEVDPPKEGERTGLTNDVEPDPLAGLDGWRTDADIEIENPDDSADETG